MKVTYEFDVNYESDDELNYQIFQRANKMYSALSEISDYLRTIRKGWCEDNIETMEDKLSDWVVESGIHELE